MGIEEAELACLGEQVSALESLFTTIQLLCGQKLDSKSVCVCASAVNRVSLNDSAMNYFDGHKSMK